MCYVKVNCRKKKFYKVERNSTIIKWKGGKDVGTNGKTFVKWVQMTFTYFVVQIVRCYVRRNVGQCNGNICSVISTHRQNIFLNVEFHLYMAWIQNLLRSTNQWRKVEYFNNSVTKSNSFRFCCEKTLYTTRWQMVFYAHDECYHILLGVSSDKCTSSAYKSIYH